MTDRFRTIDRGSSAYGEEEIDLVIQGELFGYLDIFDRCEWVIGLRGRGKLPCGFDEACGRSGMEGFGLTSMLSDITKRQPIHPFIPQHPLHILDHRRLFLQTPPRDDHDLCFNIFFLYTLTFGEEESDGRDEVGGE